MCQVKQKQLKFEHIGGWGGKRTGSGRHNLSGQVNHIKRPEVSLKVPMHITLRLKEKLPSIRSKKLFKEFQRSVARARELGLYVIHFSIQSNHIHLFCESPNNRALALGMRALAGRFAKIIRAYSWSKDRGPRKGSVFKGRYHLHLLKTPRETRNALEYVLLNLSKHQKLIEYIDPFSSGGFFRSWKELLGKSLRGLIKSNAQFYETHPLDYSFLSPPQSWLARAGWKRACN